MAVRAKTNVVAVATLFGLVAFVLLGCCVTNNEVLGATIDDDKRQQHQPPPAPLTVAAVEVASVDKYNSGLQQQQQQQHEQSEKDEVVALDAPMNSDETDDYGSVEQLDVGGVSDEGTVEAVMSNESAADEGE